jgi:hypothetical protein
MRVEIKSARGEIKTGSNRYTMFELADCFCER